MTATNAATVAGVAATRPATIPVAAATSVRTNAAPPAAGMDPSASRTPGHAAATPPSTATPAVAAWVVVVRWEDGEFMISEPFTVPDPWWLCWRPPEGRWVFQVMIGDEGQTAWELHSGALGATAGAFDVARGGTFRLMFHTETPYSATVVTRQAEAAGDEPDRTPCGE